MKMFKNVIKKPTLYRSYIWDGTTETFDALAKALPHYNIIMTDDKRIEATFVPTNKVICGIEVSMCICTVSITDTVLKNMETGEAIFIPMEIYVRKYVEVASPEANKEVPKNEAT
jgi:hypothetical protein